MPEALAIFSVCAYLSVRCIMQHRSTQIEGWQQTIHSALYLLESIMSPTRYTLLLETNPNRTDGYTYPTLQAADASRMANQLPRTAIVHATPDENGNYPALTAAELANLHPLDG